MEIVDATWGAGYLDQSTGKFKKKYSGFYFFTDPDKFALKHYPKDSKWLFTKKRPKTLPVILYFTATISKADGISFAF
jgi:transglutaminase/protease-like cytokinesis protein 3